MRIVLGDVVVLLNVVYACFFLKVEVVCMKLIMKIKWQEALKFRQLQKV